MDLTKSIEPKSDQMNAEDLLAGPRTFTITEVREGSAEQPMWVYFAEHPQPFKPSKTVRRLMVVAWGLNSATHVGKRMTLYRDPDIKFAGDKVGGIRVSHMSGIQGQMSIALSVTRGKRQIFVVDRLADEGGDGAQPRLDALVAAFDADAQVRSAAARLAYAREVVGRPLGSAGDLTADEVATVIGSLQPVRAAEPVSPPAPPVGPASLDELSLPDDALDPDEVDPPAWRQ